jgi:hypothetical protein
VAQFNHGGFPLVMHLILDEVTTPEIIDQIHELILEHRQISHKSLAERLGWVSHEDLDM